MVVWVPGGSRDAANPSNECERVGWWWLYIHSYISHTISHIISYRTYLFIYLSIYPGRPCNHNRRLLNSDLEMRVVIYV